MNKQIIITAAILGVLAVISGAFAAHALSNLLSLKQIDIWRTGVQYQFYHVFALLALSAFTGVNVKLVRIAYYLFTVGIILFSGSLYLLACRDILGWQSIKLIGIVTPIGGLLFIAGWITMGLAAYQKK